MNLYKAHAVVLTTILLSILFSISDSDAQDAEIASSLNPVGSGARATGMGGAFIGVADDATAASWNPAGLVQLERPEISVVHSYFKRNQEYRSSVQPEIASENSMDADGLNYVSLAYPFVLFDRNMTVSLNYQRLFEMNKDVRFNLPLSVLGEDFLDTVEIKQKGFLYAVSPALAVQVSPHFYIGATLNLWDNCLGKNGWEKIHNQSASGVILGLGGLPFSITYTRKDEVSFKGTNANFGFLWMINDSFTLGGIYKTPFDANFKRKIIENRISTLPPRNTTTETNEELTLKMPASYGLGLSYRKSDNWTIAFDVYRTDWSKSLLRDGFGIETNFLNENSISAGRLNDTTHIRLGTEYLFIREKDVIPVRFGVFYDPEPQTGHLDEYYGFSLGTGYARGRFVFDIAYQYRTGKDLTGDITGDYPASNGSDVDVSQHIVMTSLIFYFE
jgi:long-subunit fatty acid transport protein